ncbi:dihydrofolate reductase family protein [Arthrobacter sp. VKM Ac-2550]|uniref:dihydrofolate reductase family protein n=1 Tax=Crystallibacter permensis TaxID=1938888 RepID=UPI00222711FA|nr:dihydrofolate reductase family protein [Arthrobacter sp. VKM Ac-2550]
MMAKLRVAPFCISLDGYGAGPDQSAENPLGVGGERLHEWVLPTRAFRSKHGMGDDGETGVDNDIADRSDAGIGATIMGRNMFGPVRGRWEDSDAWTGWWGDNPPFHHPVFVLTHHKRAPLEMEGGTTFHFVSGGIHAAREQAIDAAGGLDVKLGDEVSTIRQYLQAGLVDELQLSIVPILLGSGERPLTDLGDQIQHYRRADITSSTSAAHFTLVRDNG